jgi:hypothetical protein
MHTEQQASKMPMPIAALAAWKNFNNDATGSNGRALQS